MCSAHIRWGEKLEGEIELGFLLMSKFEQWPSGWPKIEADSPHGSSHSHPHLHPAAHSNRN